MTMPGFMQSAKGQGTLLIAAFFFVVFLSMVLHLLGIVGFDLSECPDRAVPVCRLIGGQYGHHNSSDHCRHSVACWRRFVRPRALVLGSQRYKRSRHD